VGGFHGKVYPDMIGHFSSCKSPHQIWACSPRLLCKETAHRSATMYMVSIMPCTAKNTRWSVRAKCSPRFPGHRLSITTRELARMIKQAASTSPTARRGTRPYSRRNSGAGTIFGVTGGVMEAALRTAYDYITGGSSERGLRKRARACSVKEGTIQIQGSDVKVAVAHGFPTLRRACRSAQAKAAARRRRFISSRSCMPGGCVGAAASPTAYRRNEAAARPGAIPRRRKSRGQVFARKPGRKKLYAEFLKEAGGKQSHKLLHTTYKAKPEYKNDYRQGIA